MRTYTQKGICGYGTVYVMERMEDFDEYEKILGREYIERFNPNFYEFKKEFKERIGTWWEDRKQLRYMYNGKPVYVRYKIIGLEDNNPFMDWYWIVQNEDDSRDVRYINCNDPDF